MNDCFGREFDVATIVNADCVSFIEGTPLNELSDEQKKELVLTQSGGKKRVYLLSELQDILKANHYCRLTDPNTREDLLPQIPVFEAAIEFEKNSAHYNASILNKHPKFVSLLTTYVKVIFNNQNDMYSIHAPIDQIPANTSTELDKFYEEISNFSDDEKEAFDSLFINNRNYFEENDVITMPAKWEPATNIERETYTYCKDTNQYQDYSHRNVLLGDLLGHPEDACMHSWGMDVMYLLLEYHIGINHPFSIYDQTSKNYPLEKELHYRLTNQPAKDLLDFTLGQQSFTSIHQIANADITDLLATIVIDSNNTNSSLKVSTKDYTEVIGNLKQECDDYYAYLEKVKHKQQKSDPLLDIKLNIISAMRIELNDTNKTSQQQFDSFSTLFNSANKNLLRSHRDSRTLRFLNIVVSLLTFGIKNLISSQSNNGYCAFFTSRGGHVVEQMAEQLILNC